MPGALSTHGKRITITRDKGIINSSNRFKKRVKGAFYLDFVIKVVLMSRTVSLKFLQGLRDWSLATTMRITIMTVMTNWKVTTTTW